jgi:hypothetical protein
MDNTILISKYIQKALEESAEIKSILGENSHKIFPLLQPDNLTFPFIVHARNSLTVTYTKDMHMGIGWTNNVQYTISCVSNEYIQCIELANAVRHALEGMSYKDNDISITPIQLLNVSEYTVNDDTFVEELQFQMQAE